MDPASESLDSSLEGGFTPVNVAQSDIPPQPKGARGAYSFFHKFNNSALHVALTSAAIITIVGMGGYIFTSSKPANEGGSGAKYNVGNLSVDDVKDASELNIGKASSLAINGQIQANKGVVIAPGSEPTSPTAGQLYYDGSSNQLYFYDGTSFIPTGSRQSVTSIGGASGVILIGNGLQMNNGQISVSANILQAANATNGPRVTSFQGQTGDVNLVAGNGISISGTTISSSGVVSLTATGANLTITKDGNGNYTVADTSVGGSGPIGSIAYFTGSKTLAGSILSQSGTALTVAGDLSVNGILSTDTVQPKTTGGNLSLSAGAQQIIFTANGITYTLPNSGPASQTICTTGVTCASGGGIAVMLQPGVAQTDNGAGSSVFINNTGGGNLLQLQGNGTNRFVVNNAGHISTGTIDYTNVIGRPASTVTDISSVSGSISLGAGLGMTGSTLANTGVTGLTGTANQVFVSAATGNVVLSLPQDIAAASNVTFNNLSLTGTLGVAGATTLSSTLSVAGTSSFTGLSTFNGGLTVANNSNFSQTGTGTFTTGTGDVTLNGNTSISGTNTLTVGTGATSLGGTFGVAGLTTLSAGLNVIGASSFAGNISQSGATTFSTGTGAVSLNGSTAINGNASISGTTTLSLLNCTTFANGGNLTTNAIGQVSCSNDDSAPANTVTGVGTNGRLSVFTGANTVTDSWFFQNGSNLELDNTRNLSLIGGNLSVTGTSTISGLATFNGGLTVANNSNFSQTGTGTFSTGTGAVSLNGNTDVTGANTFTVGTGATTLGGTLTVTALATLNAGLSVTGVSSFAGNISQSGATTFSTGTGAVSLNGNTSVTGSNTFGVGTGASTFGGNISQTGATTLSTGTGAVSLNGNTSITGVNTLTVGTGATDLGGTLTVAGLASLNAGLNVTGASTFGGNIGQTGATTFSTGTGAVSLNGNTVIAGVNTLTVGTGATSLGGTLTVAGLASLNAGLNVTGASSFAGNIGQTGATTFSTGTGAISLNGNTSITGVNTLTVGTGATDLGGTLTVAGLATLNAGLNVTGASSFAGNISQSGATTFSTGTGATSLNGATSVTGSNTFNVGTGTSTFAGNIGQTGATTFSTGSGTVSLNGNTSITGVNTLTVGTGATALGGTLTVAGLASLNAGLNVTGSSSFNGSVGVTGANTFTTGTGTVTLGSLGTGLVQSSAAGILSSGAVDRNSNTYFSSTLNVSNGGTGASTFSSNGVLYGNGSGTLLATAAGTSGQLLLANAIGVPTFTTLGGDLSITVTGAATVNRLQNNTLTLGGLANGHVIQHNGTDLVNGLITNNNLQAGTFSNITGTGALNAGSITSGFGTISTANNITTTAIVQGTTITATGALQGNTLSINSGAFAVNSSGTITAVAGITNSGSYTQTGTNVNTFTGSTSFSNNISQTGASTFSTGTGAVSLNGATSVTGNNAFTVGTGATNLGGTFDVTGASTLTGAVAAQGGLTVGVATTTTGTISFANATNSQLTLIQAIAPSGTGNVTYQLPTATGGSTYTICTDAGNCSGAGGGVTASGGSVNRIPKFTGAQTISNSALEDDGTNVTVLGTAGFIVQGGGVTLGSATQNGTLTIFGSGNAATIQTASLTANRSFTLPNSAGEFCIKEAANCSGAGGGNASSSAEYLTLSADASLSAERVFTAGTNLSFADGGANSTLTIATVNNPVFSTSVTTPLLTSTGSLTITPGGALTIGANAQTALMQGSTVTISSASGAISLDSSSTIELLDATNVTGNFSVSGNATVSSLNCTTYTNGGQLTTNASGQLTCTNDSGAPANAVTGTGTSGRLTVFNGANTVTDSWFLQNGSNLELDNTRNLSLLGGNLSVTGTATISGLATFNGGVTVANNGNLSQTGTGTLSTGTGAVSLNGATSVTGANAFNVGTGDSTFGGNISQTGATTFSTGTGAVSLNGNSAVTGSNTFTVGSGATALGGTLGVTGAATFSTDILQSGSGTFTTGSGAVSLNGNTSVSGTRTLTVGTGATSLGGTLTVGGILTASSLGATDTVAYLCRNSTNQLAGCNTTGVGAAFVQGGNSFGVAADLGTNDNFDLNFRTNNTTQLTLTTMGDLLFASGADRTISIAQSASGTGNQLTVASGQGNNGAGGVLSLLGGAANGVNQNGGGVAINGGTGSGSGINGDVTLQTSGGRVGIGTSAPTNKLTVNTLTTSNATTSLAQVAISTSGTAASGLIVQGVAGQAADPIQLLDSSGTKISSFDATGYIRGFGIGSLLTGKAYLSTAGTEGALQIETGGNTNAGLIIQRASAQFSDLQRFTNSNGIILTKFDANGGLTTFGSSTTHLGLMTPSGVSSSVAGTNNFYKVTALNTQGQETVGSTEVSGGTGTTISWAAVPGATTYRVYRGTSSNGQNGYTIVTAPSVSLANADTAAFDSAGTPPTSPVGVSMVIGGFDQQTANLLQFQDGRGNVLSKFTGNGQLVLGRITNTGLAQAGSITFADGIANNYGITLSASPLTANRSITFPDSGGTICTSTTGCTVSGAGANTFIQNGVTLQSNANFNISSISALSVVGVLQATAGQSADIFQVKNDTPSVVFKVAANGNVGIGGTASYKLDVSGALRLQPTSAPTVAAGVTYFDSGSGKFKCSEDGTTFVNCINSAGNPTPTLQDVYNYSGATPFITITDGRGMVFNGVQPAASSTNGATATTVLTVNGGKGANTTSINGNTAGTGGAITYTAGAGGDATGVAGANVAGLGGSINLTAGAGGTVTSGAGTAGTGGKIILQGGLPGSGGSTGGLYGNITLQSSGGNVGIGSATATYKLDVAGAMRLQPSSAPAAARGVTYFDSTANKFKCSEDGSTYVNCIAAGLSGSGTTNFLARFTPNGTTLGSSIIYDDGTSVGIASTAPVATFDVGGSVSLNEGINLVTSDVTNLWSAGGNFESSQETFVTYNGGTVTTSVNSKISSRALDVTAGATFASGNYGGTSSASMPTLTPGTVYTLSFWVKSVSNAGSARVSVQNGGGTENCLTSNFTPTTTWTRFTQTCTLDTAQPSIYFYSYVANQRFVIDGLQITQSSTARPFVSGSVLANQIAVNTSVRISGNVSLGSDVSSYKLDVAGASRLQPTTAPTVARGVTYFDSTTNKFRCSEDGVSFVNCIAAGSTPTLQGDYTNSAGGTTPEILLDATRAGVDIQDANTTLGATVNLFAVRGSASATTLGPTYFNVQGNGNVGIGVTTPAEKLDVNGNINVNYNAIKQIGRKPRVVLIGNGGSGTTPIYTYLTSNNLAIGTIDTTSSADTLAAQDYDIYLVDAAQLSAGSHDAKLFKLWKTYGKKVISSGNDTPTLYPATGFTGYSNITFSARPGDPHVTTQDVSGATDLANYNDPIAKEITSLQTGFSALYVNNATPANIDGAIGESATGGIWFHDQTGGLDRNANSITLLKNIVAYMTGGDARFHAARVSNAGFKNLQTLLYTDQALGTIGIGTTTPQQALTVSSANNLVLEMATPSQPAAVVTATGGTLGTGTYYYTITALDGVGGQTASGPESAAVIVVTPTSKVDLTWAAVNGATSYRVWRSNTSGSFSAYFTTTTNSFSDTGTATTGGTLPLVTTAYSVKISNGTSYINGNLGVGQSSASYKLDVNGALRLGTQTSVPAAAKGVIYFDNTLSKFRCSENGTIFIDCVTGGTATTLQNAYDASGNAELTVNATNGALTVRDAATPIAANIFEVQNNARTTTMFAVTAAGTNIGMDSSVAFRIQNAAGTSTLFVADTSAGVVKIGTTATATLGSAALAVTNLEVNNILRLGDATNGVSFNDQTSAKLRLRGTARNDITRWLKPEFEGATLYGDGSSNTGSMTSNFCSASSLRNIAPAACPTAGDEHTYYGWTTTQATPQDYDMYVRWDIPSNYDTASLSDTTISAYGYRTSGSTDLLQISVYDSDDVSASPCGAQTNVATGTSTWTLTPITLSGCTFAPGQFMTIKVKFVAGTGNFASLGEIKITYKSTF